MIEADPSNRRLLGVVLGKLGVAAVETCSTAREAWEMLEDGLFNLVFLDWSADIDAPVFLRRLRHIENRLRMLPVIVTTGYAEPRYLDRVIAAGANEFVLKPYSRGIIAARLASILNEPRLFIRNDCYFGPDRRRRRAPVASDRRAHQNWAGPDRRRKALGFDGPERRQGLPGFVPLERRSAPRA
ncbi:MAG TPA: response regulator [Candidatus Omnitrophota bacterium]|nr:response regulator [Candidatus Omnitrophota bacterium]